MNNDDFYQEEIDSFESESEYEKFLKYIEELLALGTIEEIASGPNYYEGFGEISGARWFMHKKSGNVWRLVPPDYPFRGLWKPVNK